MENPIKIDDLGVPLFLETPICYPFWIRPIIWSIWLIFFCRNSVPTSRASSRCLSDCFFGGTLPETTIALKMDGSNTIFLLGRPIFRGHVSFREGNVLTSIFPTSTRRFAAARERTTPSMNLKIWTWQSIKQKKMSILGLHRMTLVRIFFGESLCYSCCHFFPKMFKPYGDSCILIPRQIQVACKTVSWI